jgi:retron-type reverse transcriptase
MSMTDQKPLRHIRTFQDIRLEKARLRYEILLTENRLMTSLNAIQGFVTLGTFFSRFSRGFAIARNVSSKMGQAFSWIFGKKKKKPDPYRGQE